MNLLDKMKNIVYRPDFFGSHAFEVKKGLRFYSLLLLFFIALKVLFALPATVRFYENVLSDTWEKQQAIVTGLFPDELVLSIEEGKVSTNVNEPYAIAIPREWRTTSDTTPTNLLVINTQKSIEKSDFAAGGTLIILGERSIGFHDSKKREFHIYDLNQKDWEGVVRLDKEKFAGFIAYTANIVRWVLIIGCVALPFIIYVILWIAYLICLVFGAIIVWLGARLRGHQITYGNAYVAGMYLFPIPFLYELLSSYGQGFVGNMPFAFTLILFVMTLINFPKKITTLLSPAASVPTTSK